MIIYRDECVQCPIEKGCAGRTCPKRGVLHAICDRCHEEAEQLYKVDGDELCLDCVVVTLEKVVVEDD